LKILLRTLPFLLLALAMFYYPQEVLYSATNGISLWWNYILPALFPFFIVSELLLKQGFVSFLGVLLEPLMRPLFHLPGKAAFIIAMTHTSGIPIGAVLTCQMRKEGELTKTEGERLLAFTCNPSPGYMFGAVASGMLGNPALGIIIVGSVYLSNFLVGIAFRFYNYTPTKKAKKPISPKNAWLELKRAQLKNKKPIGEMLSEAVRNSTETILLVGGFIVFFAIIVHLMKILYITAAIAKIINILSLNLIPIKGASALIEGIMETTLGCKAAITAFSSLNQVIGLLAFLLGWGGISVFAQVASFTASTDLKILPFIIGRTIHAFLALIISQILLFFSEVPATIINIPYMANSNPWLYSLRISFLYFLATTSILLMFSLFSRIIFNKTN